MIRSVVHHSDNSVKLIDNDIVNTFDKIQPGFYDIERDQYGQFTGLTGKKLPHVHPLLPTEGVEKVNRFVDTFISSAYSELLYSNNMVKRDGILLEGAPGIGKSNYVNHYINKLVKDANAIIFNCNTYGKLACFLKKIQDIRLLQSNLIVLVLEEFDCFFSDSSAESTLKNLLDGIDGVDNQFTIATTNYIGKIPESLKSRKSRFKYSVNISLSEDRDKANKWLKDTIKGIINDVSDDDLVHLSDICYNRSIDDIKHICIDFKMGLDFVPKKKSIGFK